METIRAVVDGKFQAVPVLTNSHLVIMSEIRSGSCPGYAPDILQDLIDAGLVEETANELAL